MTINQIQQIGLPVKHLETAILFYQDTLGMKFLFQTETMAFFDCNGIRLMLSIPEKKEFAQVGSVIYFQTEQIEETYDKLIEKGVLFLDSPHLVAKSGQIETWMVFFKDSEGNTLALINERLA
ncbi:glyoxalase [Paenibacillus selenitireducens]|uniref:Glyoxalase n=1 Tax=Paenibacillus selenitireducens TaxID=1324314 RepID=A0A1T2XGA2_9BACL|nr:glyoxalase [Paenibacillus selenitireducens]